MSSGRKASSRPRRRSSGKIRLPVTTPQAMKLKTMLTKKQICARMSDPPMGCFHVWGRLAVSDARIALPNFYNVTIRIANVAARLAVLGFWLRDKLGSSASPQFIAGLDVGDAGIHEAVDLVGVGRDAERDRRFVGCRTAADIDDEPHVCELEVARRALAVASAQNATAEDLFV